MKKNIIFILFVLFLNFLFISKVFSEDKIFVGDLLLQDLDGGALCSAIETVTRGYHDAKLSHVAMIIKKDGKLKVIEAYGSKVQVVKLSDFLRRSKDKNNQPKVLLGRLIGLTPFDRKQINDIALTFVGLPYDKYFKIGNEAMYCSELVYEIFKKANNGKEIFYLAPMTFKDPDTNQILPIWTKYFMHLPEPQPVPEGDWGISPGQISRSPYITIHIPWGLPDGFHKH